MKRYTTYHYLVPAFIQILQYYEDEYITFTWKEKISGKGKTV